MKQEVDEILNRGTIMDILRFNEKFAERVSIKSMYFLYEK